MRFQPVQPETLSTTVADQIRQAILAGHLPPGSPVIEYKLAEELGVSRAPVREALRQLAEEGLIVSVPYKGAQVVELDTRQIEELYSLRAVLEEFATRRVLDKLTAEQEAQLVGHLEAMHAAADKGDRAAVAAADLAFHETLCQFAEHTLLYKMWSDIRNRTRLCLNVSTERQALAELAVSHDAMMAAILARNVVAATTAISDHILQAGARLAAEMPRPKAIDG